MDYVQRCLSELLHDPEEMSLAADLIRAVSEEAGGSDLEEMADMVLRGEMPSAKTCEQYCIAAVALSDKPFSFRRIARYLNVSEYSAQLLALSGEKQMRTQSWYKHPQIIWPDVWAPRNRRGSGTRPSQQ